MSRSRLRLRLSTTQIIRAVAIVAAATYFPSKDHAPSKPVSIGEGEGVLSHFVCALLYTCFNFNSPSPTPLLFLFKKRYCEQPNSEGRGNPLNGACMMFSQPSAQRPEISVIPGWCVLVRAMSFSFSLPFFFVFLVGVNRSRTSPNPLSLPLHADLHLQSSLIPRS